MPTINASEFQKRIGEFTDIVDCSWRHDLSTVDSSATLTNSVVDSGCVVGANVVLEETVLLPGAIVQANCVIRSSIIGPGAVIGSYSQLGATCVVGANEHVPSAFVTFATVVLCVA